MRKGMLAADSNATTEAARHTDANGKERNARDENGPPGKRKTTGGYGD
jgi:hypothetical protein